MFFSCEKHEMPNQFITILGNLQDAGYPHIGCEKIVAIKILILVL